MIESPPQIDMRTWWITCLAVLAFGVGKNFLNCQIAMVSGGWGAIFLTLKAARNVFRHSPSHFPGPHAVAPNRIPYVFTS